MPVGANVLWVRCENNTMGKIGIGELAIVFIIALLVIGPDKLPQAGKWLGKSVRSIKKFVSETTKELGEIDDLDQVQSDLNSVVRDLQDIQTDIEKAVNEEADKLTGGLTSTFEEFQKAIDEPIEAANSLFGKEEH